MSERSQREKNKKKAKVSSAIERFKKIRSGERSALDEVKEEENVYDLVDDDEFTQIINKRKDDNWIVDDNGCGNYYEDGREIFDDVDDDSIVENKYTNEYESYGSSKGKKVPLKKNSEKKKIGSLKSYLYSNQKNVIEKKSFNQMQIADDDLLKNILDGINTSSTQSSQSKSILELSQTPKNKRKLTDFDEDLITNNPFSVSSETNLKKIKTESIDEFDDDSLLDNIANTSDACLQENFNNSIVQSNNKIVEDFKIEKLKKENDDSFYTKIKDEDSVLQKTFNDNYTTNSVFNLEKDENQNEFFNFYYIDIYEDLKQPGTLYLFGKIYVESCNNFLSCCLIVKKVEHKILVYPRSHFKSDSSVVVTTKDVLTEIKEVLNKHKIKNFRSKITVKNYAFEKDIVTKSEYIEVLYEPTVSNSLPSNLEGETFSCVFGTNQTSLERFLIDLNFKGPCWIKVLKPVLSNPQISWCKYEYIVEKPFTQIKIENCGKEVPLSFLTFSIKTYLNTKTKTNEIISISCIINREFFVSKSNDKNIPKEDNRFCIISKPSSSSNINFPFNFKSETLNNIYKKTKVDITQSERELLNLFIAKFSRTDPDLIIGHDLQSFDFNILLSRLAHHKIPGWSKLGRLRRSRNLTLNTKDKNEVTVGRLVCDTVVAARELIRSKSYDLTELTSQILKKNRQEISQQELPNYYQKVSELIRFIDVAMLDSSFILDLFLELNILPLYLEITKIAGNILSRTLLGGRAERNEYLLLHAFNSKNYVYPDKVSKNKFNKLNEGLDGGLEFGNKRKKAAFTGGLVLDPKVGFYDKYILLMDFNSLYPSIIQEFNICFTTVDRKSYLLCLNDANCETLPETPIKNCPTGILPTEIKKLVDNRREVKKLLCDIKATPEEKQQLDIKQKALKLTANSMYGCLGFSNSRFYAKPLAAMITAKGREILNNTKQLAESLGFEVIYGDTDSIMINTNSSNFDDARSIGFKLQAEINKQYKQLEIGIDGVFRSILLLKKKKYAAVVATKENNQIKFTKEVKGLDIVRRDWSVIARKVGEKVLDEILSFDKTSEQIIDNIHNYLSSIAKEINEKKLTLNNYIISKQLTKNPEDYADKKSLSHVVIALRMNQSEKRSRSFKSGDTIPYLICINKEDNAFNQLPSTQRAIHPEELKENPNLEIDAKYYLQQQIHPIISRLCDPIDGTNANVIAEFLGIESTVSVQQKGADLDFELISRSNETRFDTCKPLVFKCPKCKETVELRNLIEKTTNEIEDKTKSLSKINTYKLVFDKCVSCNVNFNEEAYKIYFKNMFKVYINSLINEYYQTWFTCEDPICKFRTRRFTSRMTKKGPICPECNESILYADLSDAQLYMQLNFFEHILDVDKVLETIKKLEGENLPEIKESIIQLEPLFKELIIIIKNYKKQMAYNDVDLTFLFNKQVFSFLKNF